MKPDFMKDMNTFENPVFSVVNGLIIYLCFRNVVFAVIKRVFQGVFLNFGKNILELMDLWACSP